MTSGRLIRHRLAAGLAALALGLSGLVGAAPAWAAGKRPVVVELFTSQGCSSCPPADALLGQLADRPDVLALTLPITYWDMLGWKDTLASDANTSRQKAYSDAMGHGGVYTPQMIVDGVTDVVGNREPQVMAAIAARQADAAAVPVSLTVTTGQIHVAVGADDAVKPGKTRDATIWMFHVLGKATVAIKSGENGGHSVTYRNVVRDVRAVGMWKGQPVSLDLPRGDFAHLPDDIVAVVVQQDGYGRIVGAAAIQRPDYVAGR